MTRTCDWGTVSDRRLALDIEAVALALILPFVLRPPAVIRATGRPFRLTV
jgi:hypothetical protein